MIRSVQLSLEDSRVKQWIVVITYTVILVLVVINFRDILKGIWTFIGYLRPLFIGIAIAFVLNRPYEKLRELYGRKMGNRPGAAKVLAILTVYLAVIGGIVLLVRFMVPQIVENVSMFVNSADQYVAAIQRDLNQFMDRAGIRQIDMSEVIASLNNYLGKLDQVFEGTLPQIWKITSNAISCLAEVIISLVLSVYLMSGKEKLIGQCKRVLRTYCPGTFCRKVKSVCCTVNVVFDNYVVGQLTEALILGSLCFIGMIVLRIDYAGLISIIIAVTALVPVWGAYIGGGVAVLLLLFVEPKQALVFLVFLVILQQVENSAIYPKIVGNKIGLSGFWVLLGITVGGGMFGIVGMLIGVPVTTVLSIFLKNDVLRREHGLERK